MCGGNDASVSTLTEFLCKLVFSVDDEDRIERREAMSLLLHDGGLPDAILCASTRRRLYQTGPNNGFVDALPQGIRLDAAQRQ